MSGIGSLKSILLLVLLLLLSPPIITVLLCYTILVIIIYRFDAPAFVVIDLEPLMGAGGHSVIISSDVEEFLHVHPAEEVEPNWKGGPHISFRTTFPKPGLYKTRGQFQHKGKIIMADFILKVA